MKLKIKKDLKNIRYIKQPDKYSCGPTAILNILKYCKYDVSSKYLPNLKKYCKTDRDGTSGESISRVLKRYSKIEFKCVPYIKIKELYNHIKNNGAAIIEISWYNRKKKCEEGHFYVIIGVSKTDKDTYYEVINWEKGYTRQHISKKEIIKEFKKCTICNENPRAWLIRRKE